MPLHSRRAFLKRSAAYAALGSAYPLGLNLSAITQAAAQSSGSGYRALVCVLLYGGNDAFNTVLATDSTSWTHYQNHRNPKARNPLDTSSSIALLPADTPANASAASNTPEHLGGVLPIVHAGRAVHAGRQFALHPALKQVQALYQGGHAAVLANVGPLIVPTTKADWMNEGFLKKPAKLFSHNDQQSTWQSFGPEGTTEGWGGRMGDLLKAMNGVGANANVVQRSFTCMSPTNTSVWMGGRTVQPFQTGATSIYGLGESGLIYGSAPLQAAVSNIMSSAAATNYLALDHQGMVQRGLQANALIGAQLPALGRAPWSTPGVDNAYTDDMLKYTSAVDGSVNLNDLALQFQMVARLIAANQAAGLGISRQLFMVTMGGFDNHSNQIALHGDALAQLDHALAYFDHVLSAMPNGDMRSQVTTFTASEFGRTFTNNGDGTDHGWGGHQLIMGGAVKGTEVYGTFPAYSTADSVGAFASPDQIQNGALLPTTSVDQYAYTLGKWMGVSNTDLISILPNLSAFDSSVYDLNFMAA